MAVKLSQSMKQTQSMQMTPQLQQAIKLLTLTHMEMTSEIAKELVENPMLEEADPGADTKNEADYKLEKLEMQGKEAGSDNFDEAPIMSKEQDDFDWGSYVESFNTNSSSAPPSMSGAALDELPNYENIVSKGMTLADHLEWQLRMEAVSDEQMKLALSIIHNINDDGYLAVKFDEILSESDMPREEGLQVLEMVQRFDPVGCGADSLVECLMAQARIQEERSPLLEKIIRGHLQDLQQRDYKKIVTGTGASEEMIRKTAELLHNFHPKPGRLVSSGDTHYVTPDIYVVMVGGEFVVQVNDDGVPRLKISQLYQDLIKNKKRGEKDEATEYVTEKLKAAMWLIKSVQNRQKTIFRVAKAIVERQQNFFKKGPRYLKPMILKDIANEIGMHESTVSRVTSNKYMHTPIGMFELKYFFSSGVGGGKDGGADVASEVLKLKIKELIDNESKKKPLSDQKIADLLSRDDLKVARRTVAKYREGLGIFSSSKRKIK